VPLPVTESPDPQTASARGRFGSTVAAGLATAALTAVACGKPWFHAGGSRAGVVVADADRSADMPLALALSLVVLAGWGTLLVTRGRVRRALVGLALLAATGVVACVATAPFVLPGQVRDRLPGGGHVAVTATGWFFTAAVAGVLSVGVLVLAWLRSPAWPTMSSRYDAPATPAGQPVKADETDLWKALDQGRDPTDPTGPSSP